MKRKFLLGLLLLLFASSCSQTNPAATPTAIDRYSKIIGVKTIPAEDFWPPIIAEGWSQPDPLPAPANTAGGEDSPFILPDGQTLYFFFTPDVSIPPEKQVLDGLTGIWVTHLTPSGWSEPQRVRLANPGVPALDGCDFVLDDVM